MKKVLIISENNTIIEDATSLVKENLTNLEVYSINTHDEALEYVLYEAPNLIILDTTSKSLNALNILSNINDDLWLNRMSIICLSDVADEESFLKKLSKTNILGLLQINDWKNRLGDMLKIIEKEYAIFEYNFKSNLKAGVSVHKVELEIENNPLHAIVYSNLLSLLIYNFGLIKLDKRNTMKNALLELIINGIEHGNCGISFEDKNKALMEGLTIFDLIEEKLKDDAIRQKKVHVTLILQEKHTLITIRDEGEGFDWKLQEKMQHKANKEMLGHGRGILISKNSVTNLEYNEKGNEVSFVINHKKKDVDSLPKIFENTKVVKYKTGDIIFENYEFSNFLCYIISGTYKVLGHNKIHLATIKPSDIFIGEMSFLLGNRRTATVIAATDGILMHLPKEQFIQKIKQYPYYSLFLARLLANKIKELNTKL